MGEAKRRKVQQPVTPNNPLNNSEIEAVKKAHDEIENREKGTLTFALTAGDLLNKAKENLEGKTWEVYLTETFPKIKPSTDRLYRLLSTRRPELEQKAGSANALAVWSIRRARSELAPEGGEGSGGARTDTQKTYDRLVKLTPEQQQEVLERAGIKPNPIQPIGPLGTDPRQVPIANVVDAITVEPAADIVVATIQKNLAPEEQLVVVTSLKEKLEPETKGQLLKAMISKASVQEIIEALEALPKDRLMTVGRVLGMGAGLIEPLVKDAA